MAASNSTSINKVDSLLMPMSLSEKQTSSVSSSTSSISENFEDDTSHTLSETASFKSLPKDFIGSKDDIHQDSEDEMNNCELVAPSNQNSQSEMNNCKFDGASAATDKISGASSSKVECDLETVLTHCSLADADECNITSANTCKMEIVIDSKKISDDCPETKENTNQSDGHSETKEGAGHGDAHPGKTGPKLNDEPHVQLKSFAPNRIGVAVSAVVSDKTVDTVKENSSMERRAFYVHPCVCSYPCCAHATKLYNQRGKLCTLFDKRYIFTEVNQAPVLVCLENENSEVMPSQSCKILWRGNFPLVLSELKDGTELMFDAVALPEYKKFIALVVWHTYKPDVIPFLSEKLSMLFLEEITGFHVRFLTYNQNKGYVRAVVNGQEVDITYLFEVVFLNGRKVSNLYDVMMLSQLPPPSIYVTVNKFLMISGTVDSFIYIATCIWNGLKPNALSLQPGLHQGKVYSACNSDSITSQKVISDPELYCDMPGHLSLKKIKGKVPPSGKEFRLKFIHDNDMKSVFCTSDKLFWGNSQVTEVRFPLPSVLKVKAHIVRQRLAKSWEEWKVIWIQVSSENVALLQDGAYVFPDNENKSMKQEIHTKNNCINSLKSVSPSHNEVSRGVPGANVTGAYVVVGLYNPPPNSIVSQNTAIMQDNLNKNVSSNSQASCQISNANVASNSQASCQISNANVASNSQASRQISNTNVASNSQASCQISDTNISQNSEASCQLTSMKTSSTPCSDSGSIPEEEVVNNQINQTVYTPILNYEESQIQPQKPDSAVTQKTEDSKKKGHLYRVCCTIEKVATNSGIIKSKGKILNFDNPRGHFLSRNVFIDGKALTSAELSCFSSTMDRYVGMECTGLLELCKPYKTCNVKVHFNVSLMWLGKIPVGMYGVHVKNYDIEVISSESSQNSSTTVAKVSPHVGILKTVSSYGGIVQPYEANSKELVFMRSRCYLFNVCLKDVTLNDVIPTGISVEYEEHEGNVTKVYIGNTFAEADSQDNATRYYLMSAWCQQYDVTLETKEKLLLSVGWLPPELEPISAADVDLVNIK